MQLTALDFAVAVESKVGDVVLAEDGVVLAGGAGHRVDEPVETLVVVVVLAAGGGVGLRGGLALVLGLVLGLGGGRGGWGGGRGGLGLGGAVRGGSSAALATLAADAALTVLAVRDGEREGCKEADVGKDRKDCFGEDRGRGKEGGARRLRARHVRRGSAQGAATAQGGNK
jgi:hypothetical protein